MNEDQIASCRVECRRLSIPFPDENALRRRDWQTILTPILGDWNSLSANRWPLFGVLSTYMTRPEYCVMVRFMWSHSEGDFDEATFLAVLEGQGQFNIQSHELMTQGEQDEFNSWPETIDIYRGCTEQTRDSVSWSTRRDVATRFARERGARESADRTGIVRIGRCRKADILAYFNTDQQEYEVLILPRLVIVEAEEQVTV